MYKRYYIIMSLVNAGEPSAAAAEHEQKSHATLAQATAAVPSWAEVAAAAE